MRFELLKELGRGSSGIVYKARDLVTGDIVAVKQLLPGALVPQHELLLARKVTHPNVCRVYDLYHEGETAFISMEFVDGGPLRGPLPIEDALPIAGQICDGLHAAHRQGIVHRDLKPDNILIGRDGSAKLTDFGLARLADPEATASSSGICGTPSYMSPELLRGQKANVRSDIYSLGLVLRELGLKGPAVSRCLEHEPSERFASAAEVRDALMRPFMPRPAPRVRGFLAASLGIVVAAAVIIGWSRSENVTRVQSAGTAAVVPSAKPSVAVLFEDDSFTPALVRGGKFRVVERAELDRVLAELKLNRSDAFDPATAQRLGRLVGAEYLLAGGRQVSDGEVLTKARLIRTETGEIVAAEEGTDLVELAGKLAAVAAK